MDLEPLVFIEELCVLWKLLHAVGKADAEANQPLLCKPRARHEDLSLEQAVHA